MAKMNINSEAADKKVGMTLGELKEFLRLTDDYNFAPEDLIRVKIGLNGQIQRIETR